MATLSRQRIWLPCARSLRQPCGTYQHYILYSSLQGTQTQTTYLHTCFVCSYHPQKAEPYHTCITIGGNLIDYPGNLSMEVADMTTFKILVNSTLSTPGARWLGLDVKNYYLGTPMEDYEYMFIPITSIPHEIIAHYKLQDIVHNGKVYMEICRGRHPGRKTTDLFSRALWLRTCTPHPRPLASHMAPHKFLSRC